MNLMKHNLVERGLAEYKVGLLYLLDRIIRWGKGYTSRGGGVINCEPPEALSSVRNKRMH